MSKAKFQQGKFFSELTASEGNLSKIQILRTGTWNHPEYGVFSITEADLDEFVFNFQANVVGHDICVDVNHDWNHTAIGWYKELTREGNVLFASIEWNDKGLELINSKEYRYFSPELYFTYKPADSDQVFRNVLYGGGITNRPFFKKMKALKMSE
jgi:phage I-like protein